MVDSPVVVRVTFKEFLSKGSKHPDCPQPAVPSSSWGSGHSETRGAQGMGVEYPDLREFTELPQEDEGEPPKPESQSGPHAGSVASSQDLTSLSLDFHVFKVGAETLPCR